MGCALSPRGVLLWLLLMLVCAPMSVLARCAITPDANGHVDIPNGWTSINDQAFQSCTSLASVTIPDSVTFIGNSAFYQCSSLASVTIPDGVCPAKCMLSWRDLARLDSPASILHM